MRKRFWLFALLLALCLVLTGCRKTVSAPPAASRQHFRRGPGKRRPGDRRGF